MSPKAMAVKSQQQQRQTTNGSPMATSSFRLPPPLSSTNPLTNPTLNQDSLSSSRTRSLENLNGNETIPSKNEQSSNQTRTAPININSINQQQSESNNPQYVQRNLKLTNLHTFGDEDLSSSTESTSALPFANENVGTIKQRSPHNPNNFNTFDSMKRSLPLQFFEQSAANLIKPSYPLATTPIYDNNDRLITNSLTSPTKQFRKLTNGNGCPTNGNSSTLIATTNNEKRLQYFDFINKDKSNKVVK